jgi:ActR/RegA family two-component response regulator
VQDRLRTLVYEMVEKGIRYEHARLELERLYVQRALELDEGRVSAAAARIGVHRNTVSRWIAQHRKRR